MGVWLVMKANDGRERSFAVSKPCVVIGRETTCDVRVPVPTVSQKHCQIMLDGGELRLLDLQSDRGTFHNGNRVQEALLVHEDQLTVGPVTFIVRVMEDSHLPNGHLPNGHAPEIVIERKVDGVQLTDSHSTISADAIDEMM